MHTGATSYASFIADDRRWEGFALRDDDIIITTAPKCGTTWLQTICALLICGPPPLPGPLAAISPWLEMNLEPVADVHRRLDAQHHRRFIKSHTPLDGLPTRSGLRYISVGRDPRDVALSWDGHNQNIDIEQLVAARVAAVGADDPEASILQEPPPHPPEDPAERFHQFIDAPEAAVDGGTLLGLATHLTQAWAARDRDDVLLLHYADLREDLDGQMRRIARFLDVAVDEATWPALVADATFESMKARATDLAPAASTGMWHSNEQFFAVGRLGGWGGLPAHALDRYEQRAAQLFSPDLKRWLEHGSRSSVRPPGPTALELCGQRRCPKP